MKLSDLYPRRYATGHDLDGKAYTLTISHVQLEEMRPNRNAPAELKPVLYFENSEKGVIMSRTMAYQVAGVVGSEETDDWTGKRITIYPKPMMVAGKQRVGIRARAPKNGPDEPPAEMAEEDLTAAPPEHEPEEPAEEPAE